jgi:hypothetical protein
VVCARKVRCEFDIDGPGYVVQSTIRRSFVQLLSPPERAETNHFLLKILQTDLASTVTHRQHPRDGDGCVWGLPTGRTLLWSCPQCEPLEARVKLRCQWLPTHTHWERAEYAYRTRRDASRDSVSLEGDNLCQTKPLGSRKQGKKVEVEHKNRGWFLWIKHGGTNHRDSKPRHVVGYST